MEIGNGFSVLCSECYRIRFGRRDTAGLGMPAAAAKSGKERVRMLRKTLFVLLCLGMFRPTFTLADSWNQRFAWENSESKFAAPETTMDLFGSLRVPENKDIFGGQPGIGIGVNHFFTRYLGAGADTGVDKFDWPNHINASLIGRYPINQWSLAPYVFAGFGRQFHDVAQWTYHFGGGVDYRLNRKMGLFLDVCATAPDVTKNFVLWRVGIRWGL